MQLARPTDGIIHFEDLEPGRYGPFGSKLVTREEIKAFASAYDPQPMHLDEQAAERSIVGGLCASGFHSCAIMMRLLCDEFLLRSRSLGSPGLDEVKWLRPVRPDARLSLAMTIIDKRVLRSRPSVGLSKMLFELVDAEGNTLLAATTNQLVALRHPAPSVSGTDRPTKDAPPAAATLWDSAAETAPPLGGDFFEDVVVGEVRDLGAHTFLRDDMIAFARQYDPQAFHLDEDAGRNSLFGGLSASGWLTASIYIRQQVRTRQAWQAALRNAGRPLANWGPSPGFRNLNWPKPVLAGDTVEYRSKVVEARPLQSRPSHGLLISEAQGRNQRGDIVFRLTSQIFAQRRGPAAI